MAISTLILEQISAITSTSGIKDVNIAKGEEEAKMDERYKTLHCAVIDGLDEFRTKDGA